MRPLNPSDPRAVGPYALLRRLGAGGMGVVYLGRSGGGRVVAVKVVRPDVAEQHDFRQRFGREVAAARAVSGAFTAPVVDADPQAAMPWMATAFVPGISLHDAVTRYGPLDEAALRVLGFGLLEALTDIHRAGLAHRDLKPGNVLLALDGPHVIDFGISRSVGGGSTLTQSGVFLGSPGYLAPEQVTGGVIGPAGDVFCLGATLVFAATGHGPFGEGPADVLVYRGVHTEPDLSDVPAALRAALLGMLIKDPWRRPSVQEAIRSLGTVRRVGRWLPQPYLDGIAAASAELRSVLEEPTQTYTDTETEVETGTETASRTGTEAASRTGGVATSGTVATTETEVDDAAPGTASPPPRQQPPSTSPSPLQPHLQPQPRQQPQSTAPAAAAAPAATFVPQTRSPLPQPSTSGRRPRPTAVTRRRLLTAGAVLAVTGTGALVWDLVEPGGGGRPSAQGSKSPTPRESLQLHGEGSGGETASASAEASAASAESIKAATVYASFNDGRIVAVDAVSGKVRWNRSVANGAVYSPALYAAGSVYTGSADDTRMFALDAASGTITWRYTVGSNGVYGTPGYANGIVYAASMNVLYALHASSGTKIWSFTTGGAGIRTMPLVLDGVVYVGSLDGGVYAVDAATGKQKWSVAVGVANNTSFAVSGRILLCSDGSGVVRALNLADGSSAWNSGSLLYAAATPTVSNGVVYVGGYKAVAALSAATGSVIWSVAASDYVFGAPAVAGTSVYVPVHDGSVVSLRMSDGTVQWRKSVTTYNIDDPALVANGMVYVTSDKVYALDAASGAPKWNYAYSGASPDGGISLGG